MKILISKPDSLGDQIIAAGFIQQLRNQYPDAKILWHTREPMKVVQSILPDVALFQADFKSSPSEAVDEFDSLKASGIILMPVPIHPWADWDEKMQPALDWWLEFLQSQTWDIALTVLRNRTWLADISTLATNAPVRLGLKKTNAWQPLADSLRDDMSMTGPYYTEEINFAPYDTEYETYAKLFARCSSFHDIHHIQLDIPEYSKSSEKSVLFAPGVGGHVQRSWPIDKWIHLSQLLSEEGWNVLWIQGPGDERFFHNHPIPEKQRRVFDANQLPQLASAIASADAFVCNDSSYVHLAAAIGTPTLAFYGCGQHGRFIPSRGNVKAIQGVTIEAGSQWHDHCDIWASIREIPTEVAIEAFRSLTDRHDTSRVEVAIDIPNPPPELMDAENRQSFFDDFQRRHWKTWSDNQANRRRLILLENEKQSRAAH